MSARAAWVLAVVCGGIAACGGRSVEHEAGNDAGMGGSGADEPGTGGSGGSVGGSGGASGTSVGSGGSDKGGTARGGAGGTVSAKGGSGGTGGSGGGTVGGTGGGKGFGLGGKAFTLVRSACGNFCQKLPVSCAMAETDCGRECVYAGTDSPSCAVQFANYMSCLAGHVAPDVLCDESCSGTEGCAGEAIASCEAERLTWERCFDECGTTTQDYESPSIGCRRSSACNESVTECAPSADFATWECTCFNIRPEDASISVPSGSDECLTATRTCWGI